MTQFWVSNTFSRLTKKGQTWGSIGVEEVCDLVRRGAPPDSANEYGHLSIWLK